MYEHAKDAEKQGRVAWFFYDAFNSKHGRLHSIGILNMIPSGITLWCLLPLLSTRSS